jgi:hypothetical protein
MLRNLCFGINCYDHCSFSLLSVEYKLSFPCPCCLPFFLMPLSWSYLDKLSFTKQISTCACSAGIHTSSQVWILHIIGRCFAWDRQAHNRCRLNLILGATGCCSGEFSYLWYWMNAMKPDQEPATSHKLSAASQGECVCLKLTAGAEVGSKGVHSSATW